MSETARTAAGVARKTRSRPRTVPAAAPATVSVVIPCYNYGRFLAEAVGSVLVQEGVTVDVIVVDDCSTDDSLAVARGLADADPRISVIAHDTNRGAVQTFNDGIPAATGEFLVRLDADDLLTPGSLLRATDLARAFPGVGLVYGRPRHFVDRPPADLRTDVRRWTVWPGRRWLADRTRDALNVITSPEAVMRTDVVRRAGGQLPLKHAHDMEMWFRLAAFSDVGYVEGPDQALHRDHPGSLSTSMTDPLDDMVERREAFRALFAGPAATAIGAETAALARRADLVVAEQALTSAAHTYDRQHVDPVLTDRFVAWALETSPAVRTTRRWAGLQRRIELGQSGVRRRPWYVASARGRQVRNLLREAVWKRRGTYDGR